MKRLIAVTCLILILGGALFLDLAGKPPVAPGIEQLRRRGLAFEHWTWVALAWGPENLTRLRLGALPSLRAPRTATTATPAPSFIDWSAWLAVPSNKRYQALHRHNSHNATVQALVLVEVGVPPLLLLLVLWQPLFIKRLGRLRPTTVRGSGRWLSKAELRALRPRAHHADLVVARDGRRRYAVPEQEVAQHILLVGPTGTGKTSGVLVPLLLEERGARNLLIVDPKSELVEATMGAIAQHHEPMILNFLDPGVSLTYNPLTMVTDKNDAMGAAYFTHCWMENTGTSTDHFWDDTVKKLIKAAILHLFHVREQTPTLNELAEFLRQDSKAMERTFAASPYVGAVECARWLAGARENERLLASILTGLGLRFEVLDEPRVRAVLSGNEVDFRRFVDLSRPPVALYLVLDHAFATQLRPISACFFTQLFHQLTQLAKSDPRSRLPRPLFCLIDEFANLGKVPHMDSWLTTLRSFEVGCALAVQYMGQLANVYGEGAAKTIRASCRTKIGLAGMEDEDAEWFSRALGKATVTSRQATTVRKRGKALPDSGQEGVSETARPLMTADEIRCMRADQLIVVALNRRATRLRQRPWYRDRRLRRLSRLPLPNGTPVPPGGPTRAVPLETPDLLDAAGAIEQAQWLEDEDSTVDAFEWADSGIAYQAPLLDGVPGAAAVEGPSLMPAGAENVRTRQSMPPAREVPIPSERPESAGPASRRRSRARGQVLMIAPPGAGSSGEAPRTAGSDAAEFASVPNVPQPTRVLRPPAPAEDTENPTPTPLGMDPRTKPRPPSADDGV